MIFAAFSRTALLLTMTSASLWLLPAPLAAAETSIHGAGATFPSPIYTKWASDYKREKGVNVRYEPIGSGAGVERVQRDLVDFGASDVPLPPAELSRIGAVQFPAVIGGVVPVVNISGIRSGELRLSGDVLAQIYLGKIRKWNASEIAALNPTLHLPNANITVVHRADSSGTTFLWSDYLAQASPEWKARVGIAKELDWPVGVGGIGNEGVASYVQRTRVSIGYVEFAFAKAHNLTTTSVRNRSGAFVQPGRTSFEAAAKSARWDRPADLAQILTNQAGSASWPVTGTTFILLKTNLEHASHCSDVIRFFDWAFTSGSQAALDLDYIPMPDTAVALIRTMWKEAGCASRERARQGPG